MYLEDFHKRHNLPTFGRSVRDPNDENSRSAFSSPNPLRDELNRNLGSHMIRASPTNKWMTETWGPEPIEYYPRERYQRADSGLHPSSTGVISRQYGGWLAETDGKGRKRPKRVRREFDEKQDREESSWKRSKFQTPSMQRSDGQTRSQLSSSHSSSSSAETDPREEGQMPPSPPRSPHVTRRVEDPSACCGLCGVRRHVDGGQLMFCVICETVPTCSPFCQLQHTAKRHVRNATRDGELERSVSLVKGCPYPPSCAACGGKEHRDEGPLKPCLVCLEVAYCSAECFDRNSAPQGCADWGKQGGRLNKPELPPVIVGELVRLVSGLNRASYA